MWKPCKSRYEWIHRVGSRLFYDGYTDFDDLNEAVHLELGERKGRFDNDLGKVNAAYSSSVLLTEEEWNFGYYENDRSGGRRGGSSTGIEEVYAGNGQRFVNIAESKSFPFELESKIFEASNTQASGELMLRFEMILFGKDTGSFSRYYEPSGKDILPLAEEVKHYLKHWGVNKYEPIEKEKLLRTHNGYIYPFYGVDPKGYTITVYAYFETIFDEHLDRIVVWTEDGF